MSNFIAHILQLVWPVWISNIEFNHIISNNTKSEATSIIQNVLKFPQSSLNTPYVKNAKFCCDFVVSSWSFGQIDMANM